jgi:hypothetical protein
MGVARRLNLEWLEGRIAPSTLISNLPGLLGGMAVIAQAPIVPFSQSPGSLQTTNVEGVTQQNDFDQKTEVYVNGGPDTTSSLPEGDYYFQVTDPSGGALLSTDGIEERRFHIDANGFIDAYLGTTHATGTDVGNGAVTVGLASFRSTPNTDGVYKAWITQVENYVPTNKGSSFGFTTADSKTSNFTVLEPETHVVIGQKFNDLNGDGVQEAGEPGIAGWHVVVIDENGTVQNLVTGANGFYSFTVQTDVRTRHAFAIIEVPQADFTQTLGNRGYTVLVDNSSPLVLAGFNFGNHMIPVIPPVPSTHIVIGQKFNDLNADGVKEPDEPGIAGWQILVIDENGNEQTLVTGSNGFYAFTAVTDDNTSHTFRIFEISQTGFTQTLGNKGYVVVVDNSSPLVLFGFKFGNHFNLVVPPELQPGQPGQPGGPGGPPLGPTVVPVDPTIGEPISKVESLRLRFQNDPEFRDRVLSLLSDLLVKLFFNLSRRQRPGIRVAQGFRGGGGGGSGPRFAASRPTAPTKPPDEVVTVKVHVFEDLNGNGVKDEGEEGLPDWIILIDGYVAGITDRNGNLTFHVRPGKHTITEVEQPDWVQTSGFSYTIKAKKGTVTRDVQGSPLHFGNWLDDAAILSITGLTITQWSNRRIGRSRSRRGSSSRLWRSVPG